MKKDNGKRNENSKVGVQNKKKEIQTTNTKSNNTIKNKNINKMIQRPESTSETTQRAYENTNKTEMTQSNTNT